MTDITRRTFLANASIFTAGGNEPETPQILTGYLADQVNDSEIKLFVPENYGAKGDGITDDTHAIAAAIKAAAGLPVYLGQSYVCGDLILTDEPLHLIGPGTLVQPLGKMVINLRRSLGMPIRVPQISTIQIGPDVPELPQSSDRVSRLHVEDIGGLMQGDVVQLSAEEAYPFCESLSEELGYRVDVYKSDLLPIIGVGVDFYPEPSVLVRQGDIVRGSRSGAFGVVMASGDNGKLKDTLVFRKVVGKFADGEILSVHDKTIGVAVGCAYLLTDHVIIDSYPSTAKLRRMTQSKFLIDGPSVRSDGDCDALVGAKNRKPAFQLRGAIRPTVRNFTIHSAWTRCWRIESCYMPSMDVFIERLPNNANLDEAGFGYGVELCGATCDGVVRVNGGNCRHGFTTNVDWVDQSWLESGFDYSTHDHYRTGNPKRNTVKDSLLKNCFGEAFDTHWGDYFTRFENCQAKNPTGTQFRKTASAGFKTRGFGTVYFGCVVDGATYGFIDASGSYDSGFSYKTVYENCRASNILSIGFYINQGPRVVGQRSTLYRNCYFRGALDIGSQIRQQGWKANNRTDIELENCRAERFLGQPYQIDKQQNWIIRGFVADYRECPQNASAPGIYDEPDSVFIDRQYLIESDNYPNLPGALIENRSGKFVTVEIIQSGVSGSYRPLVHDLGRSKTELRSREHGRLVIYRSSVPIYGSYQTGDRTVNPAPEAGGFLGFICVAAGSPGIWKGYGPIEA